MTPVRLPELRLVVGVAECMPCSSTVGTEVCPTIDAEGVDVAVEVVNPDGDGV